MCVIGNKYDDVKTGVISSYQSESEIDLIQQKLRSVSF